jgi:hypothetical protein
MRWLRCFWRYGRRDERRRKEPGGRTPHSSTPRLLDSSTPRLLDSSTRYGQRRHRELVLAADPERGAAGDERLEGGEGREEAGQQRRGGDDLLEVVEEEEEPAVADRRGELLLQAVAGHLAGAQRLGDGGEDQRRFADRAERDVGDAVGEPLPRIERGSLP